MPNNRRRNLAGFKRTSILLAAAAAGTAVITGAIAAVAIVVVPSSAFDSDGATNNAIPFAATSRCVNGFRYQQMLDGSEVGGGSIDTLAFRLNGDETSDLAAQTFGGMKVVLSSTSVPLGSMSETFANNLGPDATLVFAGDLTMGATVSGSPPHPFDFEIPINAPFEFDGSAANLLIDITVEDCPPDAPAFFDASTDSLARAYAWDKDSSTAENQSGVGLVTELTTSTPGIVAPLYDCPFGTGAGDNLTRGFYLEDFPSDRLDKVTLHYKTDTTGSYTVRLTAREDTYDGRVIGAPETRTFFDSDIATDNAVTFDFGGATVTEGATVTFTQEIVSQPSDSRIFYDTGVGGEACADVTQTNGTSPPLDTFRRDTVGLLVEPVTRMRGLGGNWTVVGHDGEGFMIHVTEAGQLVVIWFTYDEFGNQMWLIGVADDFNTNSATMNLERLTGPSFGPGFDPGDRVDENWGTLSITFDDCDSGTVSYNSFTGFGSGFYDIARLYQTEQGSCP